MKYGVLAASVALAGVAVQAHHSLSGVYDTGRRVTVEATIVEFHLVRPHPYLFFDVETDEGEIERWRGELDNLRELTAIGVTKDTFQPGDRTTVTGSPARRSPLGLYVRRLDRADGFWYEQVGFSPRIGTNKP